MAVVLSLAAALAYGLSDFVGGVASRRAGAWSLAFVSQVGGAVAVGALALATSGDPRGSDAGWAVVAGLGNGVGTAFLYRGLSSGRMGVVAPVSGVGAALVPVVVGVLSGERPPLLAWLGILAAAPAIWLVAREPGGRADPGVETGAARGSGLLDGVLAGLGFGTLFAGLAQIPEESGFAPLALNQVIGAVVVVAVAVVLRQPWLPREAAAWTGLLCGLLGASATALFVLATQSGYLTVAAVITSLYPALTVVLAALVLREVVHRSQGVGLALCAVAVALIAAA